MIKKQSFIIAFFILLFSFELSCAVKGMEVTFIIEQNNGYPDFNVKELKTEVFEQYSELDQLGRAGKAYACIGLESFPDEPRSALDEFTPSGFDNAWYDNVEDGYVYNRCHLLGYQLTGNDSINNLITGTRYLNYEGMLPYENRIAMYISNTGNHVLYRVTPLYSGDDLVAYAVQMEAYSVEDLGSGICFNVLINNIQPGIAIDYSTGLTWADDSVVINEKTTDDTADDGKAADVPEEVTYIINTKSLKFHFPYCDSVYNMKAKNKAEFYGTREEAIASGLEPCGWCKP